MLLPLYTLSLCLLLFKFVSFKVSDVNLESDINLIEKSIAAYARVHGHLPRPIQGLVPYRAIGLSKNFLKVGVNNIFISFKLRTFYFMIFARKA